MPSAQSILEANVNFPVWRENKFHSYYVSADNFNAHHVVLAEYKKIADLGAALAQLEIPYIDNIPADTLNSIVEDNTESLTNFREQVQRAIQDILDARSDPERE